jgi:hypothetical protein
MRLSWALVVAVALLAGGVGLMACRPVPAQAIDEEGSEELEINLRKLAQWRADPEHYARLKRDWSAYMALPRDQRSRLKRLDEDLHALESGTQARLWAVLQRFHDWLDRLSVEERHQIEAAADTAQKLHVIKMLREREWVAQLPRALRERVGNTPEGAERAVLIAQLRKQERDRRAEWLRALHQRTEAFMPDSQPSRLTDFPAEIQEFVRKSLLPALGEEERKRLAAVEGHWPAYPRLLVQLADRHPAVLPPGAADQVGPTRPNHLPKDLRERLLRKLGPVQKIVLNQSEGKWPDYALAIARMARIKQFSLPSQVFANCPCRPKDFTPAVQKFLEKELLPRLNQSEQKNLLRLEGSWPEYPTAVMDLARKLKLTVPGTRLPGPTEFWDRLRVALSDVPETSPRNHAMAEQTPRGHA